MRTIECETCHADVALPDALTNECNRCGTLYNMSGQRLKPIDNWFNESGIFEDTGETRADIFGPQNNDPWEW